MSIHYISSDKYKAHFFSQDLKEATLSLADLLPYGGKIIVFPDAMVKKNGMPNGLAVVMPQKETILFPLLLRDPGCGFLTFTVNTEGEADGSWAQKIGRQLDVLINTEFPLGHIQKAILQDLPLQDILIHGLTAITHLIEDPSLFLHMKFDVDANIIQLSDGEKETLSKDLMTLTNTVEIRKVAASSDAAFSKNSLLGFIHSGCELFPDILAEKFYYNIAEYSHLNGLSTLDQIDAGRFAVALNSGLGYEYSQWLKAAMNYALVSRYLIYLSVKKCLSEIFNTQTTLVNDVTHAGLFEQDGSEPYTVSTRGVQPLFHQKKHANQKLRLIAGQKESVALLVAAVNSHADEDNWIQHGTSYNIAAPEVVNTFFEPDKLNAYIEAASTSYCNTSMDIDLAGAYSFNTLAIQKYQKSQGLIEPLVILTPFINVHGHALLT